VYVYVCALKKREKVKGRSITTNNIGTEDNHFQEKPLACPFNNLHIHIYTHTPFFPTTRSYHARYKPDSVRAHRRHSGSRRIIHSRHRYQQAPSRSNEATRDQQPQPTGSIVERYRSFFHHQQGSQETFQDNSALEEWLDFSTAIYITIPKAKSEFHERYEWR
jgi:hypothetical protein